jgi:hypothetical protein
MHSDCSKEKEDVVNTNKETKGKYKGQSGPVVNAQFEIPQFLNRGCR